MGCTHTISLRDSHYATPIASQNQWGGHFAATFNGKTNITLVQDTASNPPIRGTIGVNSNVTVTDLLFLSNIGADLALSPYSGLDLIWESPLFGVRWQFLNHKAQDHQWVGALHGAYGNYTASSSSSDSTNGTIKSESNIVTAYAGVSLGYKVSSQLIPYYSYIYEVHDTNSKVTNQHGTFPSSGTYEDHGIHTIHSVGFTTEGPGLIFTTEYSMIYILWAQGAIKSPTTESYQNTLGFKIGYGW